jgi:very-short-patch-repair endonuclease
MTPAEVIHWDQLRDRRFHKLKFRRQHPLGQYIVDFYCAEQSLVVEVDGGIHASQLEYDTERTEQLMAKGYRVIRVTNKEINNDLVEVLKKIKVACR